MTKCVVSCPIDCYSGYSARSRDFVKALIKVKPDWDIKILPQRWGDTRWGFLEDHNETDLQSRQIYNLVEQPDVWIQITVPNEFQPVGKYNIGVTAGIETTLAHHSWVEGCNRMNLILVSSVHAKMSLEQSQYSYQEPSGKISRTLRITTPIEVLFEGLDISKYFPKENSSFDLSTVTEKSAFLVVGHWLQGTLGHDRKNIGLTVKSFLETFKNKKNPPALIMKVSAGVSSVLERDRILTSIQDIKKTVKGTLPNIYVLHGDLTDDEMNELYNHPKVKALVSLTKGEGFGRPLLEFAAVNKPIIVSRWSGHLDFLNEKYTLFLGGELEKVDNSAVVPDVILPEAQWFQPKSEDIANAYQVITSSSLYKKYLELAKRQGYYLRTHFSFEAMCKKLESIISMRIPEFPKAMKIILPKLEKVDK